MTDPTPLAALLHDAEPLQSDGFHHYDCTDLAARLTAAGVVYPPDAPAPLDCGCVGDDNQTLFLCDRHADITPADAPAPLREAAQAYLSHVAEVAAWPTPGIGCDAECKEASALRAALTTPDPDRPLGYAEMVERG